MKTISKLLAILLVLAMIFTLVACGDSKKDKDNDDKDDSSKSDVDDKDDKDDDNDDDKDPTSEEPATEEPTTEPEVKDDIVGTWKYEIDIFAAMDAEGYFEGDSDMYEPLFDGVTMTYVVDLKADQTFTMYLDEASVDAAAAKIRENYPTIIPAMVEAEGMTMEDFEEEILAMYGMTIDDYIDQLEIEETLDELQPGEAEGTYTYENGVAVLTDTDGDAITFTVKISGSKMTVTECDDPSFPQHVFPMTLVK